MHRIGVISDTHGLLRPEVLDRLKGCEIILHGGDIHRQKVLDTLREVAPVYAVRGNADKEWAEELETVVSLELYGVRILMIHNKKQLSEDLTGIDLVIYGHSHKYEEKCVGRIWLNPGSCGPRRFSLPITMALLKIGDGGSIGVEKIEIPHGVMQQRSSRLYQSENQNASQEKGTVTVQKEAPKEIPGNIKAVIEAVTQEAERGRSIRQIAKKHKIDEELAEQICRMYFTHPGVDADGIMTKLGL